MPVVTGHRHDNGRVSKIGEKFHRRLIPGSPQVVFYSWPENHRFRLFFMPYFALQ